MRFLLATLQAPFGSFGSVAIGENRPSWSRPSRSAMLGMLAAASGIRKDEEERHNQLEAGLGYAVRIDAPGHSFVDYHTVTAVQGLRKQEFATRRQALREGKANTLISRREWLSDSFFSLCFWLRPKAQGSLEDLAAAMKAPEFALYCGRKAGTLGLPLRPEIIEAKGLIEAFAERRPNDTELHVLSCLRTTMPGEPWVAFDEDAEGIPASYWAETRSDRLVSRSRWQFGNRREGILLLEAPEAAPEAA